MKFFSVRLLFCAAVGLALPAVMGAAADRKEAAAQLLDQNGYACSGCFFGGSDYYYCFKANDRILIGRDRVPTINWIDPDKNLLAKVHKNWKPWDSEKTTVNIRYNDKFIWVPRANGKEVRLRQDYTQDIFINSKECRAAVKNPAQK